MLKKALILLTLPLILLSFFIFAASAQADGCDVEIDFVLRDVDGNFIPSGTVDIYRQVLDADGYHKPGARVGGANVSSTLGFADISYYDFEGGGTVVARFNVLNNENAYFYFYDLSVNCGVNSFEEDISSLNIVLRDANGNLQKNTRLSIYTQKYDADNNPVKEYKDLIATLDTSVLGEVNVYLPQGSVRSIDGHRSDHYVLEVVRPKGTFIKYDIAIADGQRTSLNYFLSALEATFTSPDGSFFPGQTKVEVFQQLTDANNNRQKGNKVGDFYTDDRGWGSFEYPAGLYVLGLIGKDGQYQYFWDIEIEDQKLSSENLSSDINWTPTTGACTTNSNFTLSVGDLRNQPLAGLKFELYEQEMNLNNQTTAVGSPVLRGVIDSAGRASASFKPDSRKAYVLKIYDQNANFGEFWFYNAVRFVCGYDRDVSKNLPMLKVSVRDAAGNLKKNTNVSIYAQQLDADGRPIKENNNLVKTLNTGLEGRASLFVSPAHPYNTEKPGLYALSITGSGGTIFDVYNVEVKSAADTIIDYTLSELAITVKSASGPVAVGTTVHLYEQLEGAGGRTLGKQLMSGKTDNNGVWRFEYPAGNYALVVGDDLRRDNIFWDARAKEQVSNRFLLSLNSFQVNLNNSQIISLPTSVNLKVFALNNSGGNSYIKGKELGGLSLNPGAANRFSLSPGPYLISYYDGKAKVEYGQVIWAQNNKKQTVDLNFKSGSLITPDQVFTLSAAPLSVAINNTLGSSTGSSSSSSSGSLSNRLKGYLLLQVENKGQAWYVHPSSGKRRYLANGQDAFSLMRSTGLGISNENLNQIPIGFDSRFYAGLEDSDGDGLADVLEDAILSNKFNSDSDGDGFLDGVELSNGYDPLRVRQRMSANNQLINAQKGKILLQVHSAGQAWYLNPRDGKRYFLADGATAYQIMKYLSLGISNADLDKIAQE